MSSDIAVIDTEFKPTIRTSRDTDYVTYLGLNPEISDLTVLEKAEFVELKTVSYTDDAPSALARNAPEKAIGFFTFTVTSGRLNLPNGNMPDFKTEPFNKSSITYIDVQAFGINVAIKNFPEFKRILERARMDGARFMLLFPRGIWKTFATGESLYLSICESVVFTRKI